MGNPVDTVIPATARIIVIGDLHGDTAMLCSCLYMTKIINTNMEWVADPPNTIVIQIGDQLDSLSRNGVSGEWEKLDDTVLMRFTDKLDNVARKKGGRFISMLGNHEVMNVFGEYSYVSSTSMQKSGGQIGRTAKFRPNGTYAQMLAKRPSVLKVGDILFCHAGLLPHHLDLVKARGGLVYINELNRRVILGKPLAIDEVNIHKELFVTPSSLLWNRDYLNLTPHMKEALSTVLSRTASKAMIIGHNPVDHIMSLYDGRLWITDIGLSRSFPNDSIEVLEILDGITFNIIKAVSR